MHPYQKLLIFTFKTIPNVSDFNLFLICIHYLLTDIYFPLMGQRKWAFDSDSHTWAAELLFLNVLINVEHTGRGCRAPSLGLCLPLAVLLVAVQSGLQPRSCGKYFEWT